MSVNDAMTSLADAIRGKSGETIKLSIEAMISTVSSIETKGEAMKMGTITAAENGTSVTINHELGVVPGAILFFKYGGRKTGNTSGTSGVDYNYYDPLFSAMINAESYIVGYNYAARRYTSSGSSSSYSMEYTGLYYKLTKEDTRFGVNTITEESFNTPKDLWSGDTYVWIAFKDPLA